MSLYVIVVDSYFNRWNPVGNPQTHSLAIILYGKRLQHSMVVILPVLGTTMEDN
jgi:hypothetical protein